MSLSEADETLKHEVSCVSLPAVESFFSYFDWCFFSQQQVEVELFHYFRTSVLPAVTVLSQFKSQLCNEGQSYRLSASFQSQLNTNNMFPALSQVMSCKRWSFLKEHMINMMNMIHHTALRSHHNVNITFMWRAQREDDDVMKLCQLSASQMEKYTRNQIHFSCHSTGFYCGLVFTCFGYFNHISLKIYTLSLCLCRWSLSSCLSLLRDEPFRPLRSSGTGLLSVPDEWHDDKANKKLVLA